MSKLNPITALYLKILDFISILLIDVGGKIDDLFAPRHLTIEEKRRYIAHSHKMHRYWARMNAFRRCYKR
jgi:hypothetical protein